MWRRPPGTSNSKKGRRACRSIASKTRRRAKRIRERDLQALGRELCRLLPEVLGYLKDSWPKLLDPDRGDSGSEG
jgi:hypothetical protein